ncbi:MAG: hypothetical protein K0R98_1313 [Rickettsiaceae bacterium]|jgi:uncharacterized phage protein (TIGR02218 family)|nr:hypothetical protein [Rickettsiaceae bacterium]
MKIISSGLDSHLASEVTTLATCWKLTRKDGVVMGFTEHDKDLLIDEVTYQASSGFSPSAVANNSELSVDNLDIDGVIDSENINEEDILAGLYDFAQIQIFIVNYLDLTLGVLNLRTGWLGEVKFNRKRFTTEVRGLMQNLAQGIGQLYSPSCRAKLEDVKCGINIADFTVAGTLTSVISNQVFADSSLTKSDGWFAGGKITFTSGNNNGLSMEIKEFRNSQITLVLPMPYDISVTDTYSMHAGCDKKFDTCIAKFSNAVNFRGEPHVPGIDKMLETAGTMS